MKYAWNSLCDAPLEGDSVTRFVYIDEAGISNPIHEPFVVVAGVIVHADKQLNELERRLQRVVERYIPKEHWDGFTFHATELFSGGGKVFDRSKWPLAARLEIARDIAAIPSRMKLPLAFGIIQREHWPMTFDASQMTPKEKIVGQHTSAYMTCAMQVEMWMRCKAPDEVTMMIAEDNDQARKMIKEMQNAHRNPNIIEGLGEDSKKYFPFKKIKHSPLFEQKSDSPALQLADFCAYVMKRRAMNDQRYANLISALLPCYVIHDLPSDHQRIDPKKRR